MTKTCKRCGVEYQGKTAQKFCGYACSRESRKTRVERKCEICGESFEIRLPVIAKGYGKYCSTSCYTKAQTTKTQRPCAICGAPVICRPSRERKYCSRACFGKAHSGDGYWNWKGGVTPESQRIRQSTEYKKWREAVFARDNWTCQDCGERGHKLHAHHVFHFAEFEEHRIEIWNGVTLCEGCHWKTHSKSENQITEVR